MIYFVDTRCEHTNLVVRRTECENGNSDPRRWCFGEIDRRVIDMSGSRSGVRWSSPKPQKPQFPLLSKQQQPDSASACKILPDSHFEAPSMHYVARFRVWGGQGIGQFWTPLDCEECSDTRIFHHSSPNISTAALPSARIPFDWIINPCLERMILRRLRKGALSSNEI